MEFYWNNVTEKSGLLKPSDITDCSVYARPLYARFTVCTIKYKLCDGWLQIDVTEVLAYTHHHNPHQFDQFFV
jgi:hypothetical protein